MANKNNKIINSKVIKCNNIDNKIELSEEELKIKEKLKEIDNKVNRIEEIASMISEENKDTILSDDLIGNVIGVVALTATSKVIGEYFGIDEKDIDKLF